MKLSDWLKREAIKKMFKEKKFKEALNLIRTKHIGYALYEDGKIEITCGDSRIYMHAVELPYTQEQLSDFHRCGYIKDHPSSQKPVKRKVYYVEIDNGLERFIVETTNERIQESLVNQYRAIDYIPGRTFRHNGEQISLNTGYNGLSTSEKKKTFENIIAYEHMEDVVRVLSENRIGVPKVQRES